MTDDPKTDEPNDDLQPLLNSADTAPVNLQLRQQLLELTSRRVRGYGRWRRVRQLTALAGMYAAGLLTAWLWLGSTQPQIQPPPIREPQTQAPPEPSPVPVPTPNPSPAPMPEPSPVPTVEPADLSATLSPEQIELLAEQAQERAVFVRLFCTAGDRYFAAGQHAAALRCYRNALDRMTDAELALNSSDSWLLMSLKLFLLQERTRETVRD